MATPYGRMDSYRTVSYPRRQVHRDDAPALAGYLAQARTPAQRLWLIWEGESRLRQWMCAADPELPGSTETILYGMSLLAHLGRERAGSPSLRWSRV